MVPGPLAFGAGTLGSLASTNCSPPDPLLPPKAYEGPVDFEETLPAKSGYIVPLAMCIDEKSLYAITSCFAKGSSPS